MIKQQIQLILQQQKTLQEALARCIEQIANEESTADAKSSPLNQQIDLTVLNSLEIKDHYVASLENALKNDYVYLLIEVLKSSSLGISEEQHAFLNLLLKSMKLENKMTTYFEGGVEIDDRFITRFVERSRGSEIGLAFIADLLILLRIRGELQNSDLVLISKLITLLGVDKDHLEKLDEWIAIILGITITLSDKSIKSITIKTSSKFVRGADSHYVQGVKVGDILKEGIVNNNVPLAVLEYTCVKLNSFTSVMKNLTEASGNRSLREEYILKDDITCLDRGYFVPILQRNDNLPKMSITTLGKVITFPDYLDFWFTFVDFDELIKANI